MSDVPVQLIVAAFQDEKSADLALKELKKAKKEKLIGIQNAAVIRKDAKGKVHITETADLYGGKGAALGGVTGAVIGIIAGTALFAPVAVGALVGGLAAKLKDSGFKNERLKTLGDNMKPGSSAIVAVVEHTWVAQVEKALAEEGADAVTAELSADIASQLEAGNQVAYSVISSQEGFSTMRAATGEDSVDVQKVVVDDTGLYGGRFVATKEGFMVEGLTVTDEGAEYVAISGKPEELPEGEKPAEDEAPKAE